MKKKLYTKIIGFSLLLITMAGCGAMDETYKDLRGDSPIVYLGKLDVSTIVVQSGRERVKISWPALYDPRVEYTKITWANGTRETDVPVTYGKPTEVTLNTNLPEALYDFVFQNFSSDGLSSVAVSSIGEVFGNTYESYLRNRNIASINLNKAENIATITFPVLGDSTLVGTEVRWTKQSDGTPTTVYFANTSDNRIVLNNFKGQDFEYRCRFLPTPNAIDDFYSQWASYHIIVKTLLNPAGTPSGWTVTTPYSDMGESNGGGYKEQLVDGIANIATNYLSLRKPGRVVDAYDVPADAETGFTIDMGEQKTFDYFVWHHRYSNVTVALRAWTVSIYGSNDNIVFDEIKSNVNIPSAEAAGAPVPGTVELPSSTYQYVKVVYVRWDTNNSNSIQVSEFQLGVTE
ncbi:hypothetical protein EZS27_001878 [termite gut metagenome]|uniref:F5/8 type C domain-containing protein n=1 Tax=termite gut metagenome TaxID=433724 RepID=A0A5J4SXM5_9ZZZZ